MKISKITIEGFANIDKVSLSLSNICALLAYNNFGKSNILEAISFGFRYLIAEASEKKNRMNRSLNYIPINNATAGKDFLFEFEIEFNNQGVKRIVTYGYSFSWPQKKQTSSIKAEYLKIKSTEDLKPKSYIRRNDSSCFYLSSEAGRCSSKLDIDPNQLALNKLSNYDNLFYIGILKEILNIKIVETNALADPKTFFRTIEVINGHTSFTDGIDTIPDFSTCANFMYNLKNSDSHKYNLLQDAIKQLIPDIIDFEPIKVDLKKQVAKFKGNKDIPFDFPEYIYDIRVQEKSLNQQITIEKLSSGTKRIFYLLLMTIATAHNNVPLMMIEELENSIHPSLFQRLLITIRRLANDTQILLTSHSPYLLQYLKPETLYIGIPNDENLAIFKRVKHSKINSLLKEASSYDMSLGDFIFDMLADIHDQSDDVVSKYFE